MYILVKTQKQKEHTLNQLPTTGPRAAPLAALPQSSTSREFSTLTVSIFSNVFANHSGVTSVLITLWKLLSKGSLMTSVIKSSGKCPDTILCDLSVAFNSVYQITSPKRVFHGLVEWCTLCRSFFLSGPLTHAEIWVCQISVLSSLSMPSQSLTQVVLIKHWWAQAPSSPGLRYPASSLHFPHWKRFTTPWPVPQCW